MHGLMREGCSNRILYFIVAACGKLISRMQDVLSALYSTPIAPVRANNYSPLHPRSLNLEPLNLDGPVKSQKCNKMAIPAKAGIQEFQLVPKHWTPAFTGMTAFYGFITID